MTSEKLWSRLSTLGIIMLVVLEAAAISTSLQSCRPHARSTSPRRFQRASHFPSLDWRMLCA
jgi:BioD-like phosphotransacetylase family protein